MSVSSQREMKTGPLTEIPHPPQRRRIFDELKNWSAPFSRRNLLLAAVSAATAINDGPATAAPEMKISANAVGYQDHPNGDKQCSECVHFLPPSSCKIVEGTISPHGYCRIFARRQSAAGCGTMARATA
jgi:hypothetical protein